MQKNHCFTLSPVSNQARPGMQSPLERLGRLVALVCESSIVRVSRLCLVVVCAGVVVLVDCCSAIFFGEEFLDFPVILLSAN